MSDVTTGMLEMVFGKVCSTSTYAPWREVRTAEETSGYTFLVYGVQETQLTVLCCRVLESGPGALVSTVTECLVSQWTGCVNRTEQFAYGYRNQAIYCLFF